MNHKTFAGTLGRKGECQLQCIRIIVYHKSSQAPMSVSHVSIPFEGIVQLSLERLHGAASALLSAQLMAQLSNLAMQPACCSFNLIDLLHPSESVRVFQSFRVF